MTSLSRDALAHVFTHLGAEDLLHSCRVCRGWRAAIAGEECEPAWRALCERYGYRFSPRAGPARQQFKQRCVAAAEVGGAGQQRLAAEPSAHGSSAARALFTVSHPPRHPLRAALAFAGMSRCLGAGDWQLFIFTPAAPPARAALALAGMSRC